MQQWFTVASAAQYVGPNHTCSGLWCSNHQTPMKWKCPCGGAVVRLRVIFSQTEVWTCDHESCLGYLWVCWLSGGKPRFLQGVYVERGILFLELVFKTKFNQSHRTLSFTVFSLPEKDWADCGTYHELLIINVRVTLKKSTERSVGPKWQK